MSSLILLIIISIFSIPLFVEATENTFDYEKYIGIVASEKGKSFLAISNENLMKGNNKIIVLYEDTNQKQKIIEINIINIIRGDIPLISSTIEYNGQPFIYEIEHITNNGVAFILVNGVSNYNKKHQSLDIDGDGNNEKLIICSSKEGIHYIIKSVFPKKEILRKDFYYFLGYDVVPTCTDSDYK